MLSIKYAIKYDIICENTFLKPQIRVCMFMNKNISNKNIKTPIARRHTGLGQCYLWDKF